MCRIEALEGERDEWNALQHGRAMAALKAKVAELEAELKDANASSAGWLDKWQDAVAAHQQAESALTAARTRAEGLEAELHAVASHNRELLLHLAEAQANLNDVASKLAVEDARTTLQAKTIRGLEAVILSTQNVLGDLALSFPVRVEAAYDMLDRAFTPPPATDGRGAHAMKTDRVIGWAVLDAQDRVDSYYDNLERAKQRARELAQTRGTVTVAEMVTRATITAERGPWTYTEQEATR